MMHFLKCLRGFFILLVFLSLSCGSSKTPSIDSIQHEMMSFAKRLNNSNVEKRIQRSIDETSQSTSLSLLLKLHADLPSFVLDIANQASSKNKIVPFPKNDTSSIAQVQTEVEDVIVALNEASSAFQSSARSLETMMKRTQNQMARLEKAKLRFEDEFVHQKVLIHEYSLARRNQIEKVKAQANTALEVLDSPQYSHLASPLKLQLRSVLGASLSLAQSSFSSEESHLLGVAQVLVEHNKQIVLNQIDSLEEQRSILEKTRLETGSLGFNLHNSIGHAGIVQKLVYTALQDAEKSVKEKESLLASITNEKLDTFRKLERLLRNYIQVNVSK